MTITESELADIVAAVWTSLLATDIEVVAPAREVHHGVGSAVAISGAWEGTLRLRCAADTARSVTAEMLMLPADEVDDSMVRDTLGELANIIGGNVKALLPAPSSLGLPTPLAERCGELVASTSFVWRSGPFHVALDATTTTTTPAAEPAITTHGGNQQ